ncbi:MAG: hypothetical protein NWR47_05170 [Aestuariivirgaceae bacterium]|nr:hypothetical protein [Aestuariivirgaceae bacterium]
MRTPKPSLWLTAAAAGGFIYLNGPLLLVILYAFIPEVTSYQFPPPGFTLQRFSVAWNRADIWPPIT